jgi:hypothetical protein
MDYSLANLSFSHAAASPKPRIIVPMIVPGLISAAVLIWLISVTLSTHAQFPQYCPSGAVVTAQSQCSGAVGPIDNLTKSILRLNNSGVNNANDTAIKIQKDNKSNAGAQTAQNTISNSNITAAGNMTNSTQPSQPLSQPQIPNTIPSGLDRIFQKCFRITTPILIQKYTPPGILAFIEKEAIQNMSAPIPFEHILNNSASEDQQIYDGSVHVVKPIADCMRQEQQQPYQQQQPYPFQPYQQQPYPFQPYQQQPNNNYPPPRILSQSAYTDNIGTIHIVGEVINESPTTAKFVKIIVTFYNAYNQVIGTDNTYTEPSDLAPGQRAPFDIFVTSGVPTNQIRNYALTVDAS